ncbi:MAG TPA: HD domain-containing protein [Pyrinomonadaceae bacterium]|nr:HD domain-containing protein [Chloracidobacterium sp.]MBP9934521.1 HD domain-containing protein [Pyrinomonadaceae bacterium]MBK7802477.1 HD domain-containing protein [Chloracidobacterium sp.]MBK9437347.1 HD domain-containing protein [Chloracidobacterium sp.]MBL0240021.1 HD domain-containing protein [Chloracidobacterium sp.]
MSNIPKKITDIAEAIRSIGGRAMLVGGCVRDELMDVDPKDWDVEVYGVEPAKLRGLLDSFGEVNVVGEAFAVYKIGSDLDVSLPRRERKEGRGHRAFVVEGDPDMSFKEACSRRDFTINAILRDILTGEIVDPFDGQGDIRGKKLRMVSSETFGEDSLRVLRAAQFAARFEFDLDPETVEVCKAIDLTDLPKERIWGELEKLLLLSARPSIGLKWLYDLGITAKIFPEMQSLVGVPQEPAWHPEGNVDLHTMMVCDEARKLIDDLDHSRKVAVMLGSLAHDFGKPPTTEFIDGRIRSRGHDEAGVEPTLTFLDRLGIHTLDGFDVRNQVVQLVRYHLKPGEYYKAKSPVGDGAFRRLARKVEPDLLYRVAKADSLGRNPDWLPKEKWFGSEAQEWFIAKVRELDIEKKAPDPILMGRHLIELGLTPSPRFREILDAVYELQLDSKITDLDQAVAEAQKHIH